MIARICKELQNVMGFSDHLPPSAGFCHVSGGAGVLVFLVDWVFICLFALHCYFLCTIVIIQHRKDYINMGGY